MVNPFFLALIQEVFHVFYFFFFFFVKWLPSRAGKTLTHFAVDHSAGVRMSVCVNVQPNVCALSWKLLWQGYKWHDKRAWQAEAAVQTMDNAQWTERERERERRTQPAGSRSKPTNNATKCVQELHTLHAPYRA